MSDEHTPETEEPSMGEAWRQTIRPASKAGPVTRLRNYLLTGIIVTAPIAITLWILFGIIKLIDSRVVPLLPAIYNPQTYLHRYFGIDVYIPGIGLIVVLLGLTLIGFLAAGFFGRLVVRTGEGLVSRMPVVRSVYGALKQIFQTVLESSSRSFREVVLIEYPRRGIWAIGFITSTTEGEVQNLTADHVVNVFLPTTPNPTSGFLLFLPRKDLVTLNMTVEEAIKMVVSGGIVTPPDRRPLAERKRPVIGTEAADPPEAPRELSPIEES